MPSSDIKFFIDFFHDATKKVRGTKAQFVRGKDGMLVARALKVFSRPQLEMLALWFLAKKPKLSPTIGAMLSSAVFEELERIIKKPVFWKELDELETRYFPRQEYQKMPHDEFQPFSEDALDALRQSLYKKTKSNQ